MKEYKKNTSSFEKNNFEKYKKKIRNIYINNKRFIFIDSDKRISSSVELRSSKFEEIE